MAKTFEDATVNFDDGSTKSIEYDMEIGANTADEGHEYLYSENPVLLGDNAHKITITSPSLQETVLFFEYKLEAYDYFRSLA